MMRLKIILTTGMIILISTALLSEEKLAPQHKEWLELVDPIITEIEKEVFLQLRNVGERDKFITLFWNRRDPLPDTKENEFYKEYMERVKFADRYFGRNSVKRGSQTERGYFYLLLGPPLNREIHNTDQDLMPLELWSYRGEAQYGLPSFFYLIFYQPFGLGEYKLYSPGVDGPQKLISPSSADQALNRQQAYRVIRQIAGEVAKASLSYIPEDSNLMFSSSLSSDIVVSNIHSMPDKKFTDNYARDFLSYKDHVETDYLHDYIENRFALKVFKNSGQDYLHWTLEPRKINFANHDGNTYASFQLITRIEDMNENMILEKDEEIPLQVSAKEYNRYNRQIFAFQDMVPVIPGEYKLFLLLKNKTAKDFTSVQVRFSVPEAENSTRLSGLLLYQNRQALESSQKNRLKAFAFSGYHYLVNALNNCLPQKAVGVYAQVYNLGNMDEKSCRLDFFSTQSTKAVLGFTKPLSEVMEQDGYGINFGPVSLSSLQPGYYHVVLSIFNQNNEKIVEQKENFTVLAQPHPIIPWAYAKLHRPFPNPEHLFLLASQYFRSGQYNEAKQILDQILRTGDSVPAKLLLAQTLFGMKQYKDSLSVVVPVYEVTNSREAARVIAANYAGLKEWTSALVYLEKLLEQASELGVLNLAAECYIQLNQPERALPLLKKSLQIDPTQEKTKSLLEQIKE